jgi:predicted acetyltransferase
MLSIERVGIECNPILRNLYEHYVHDMSEWLGIETKADGTFSYDTAPLWQGDAAVFLAKDGETLIGFAVVTSAAKWRGNQAARDVKDFFILRAHRHKRFADTMAKFIWDQFRGEWLVRVLSKNKPALPFWRRAIREYTGNQFEEHSIVDQGREWIHLSFDTFLHDKK